MAKIGVPCTVSISPIHDKGKGEFRQISLCYKNRSPTQTPIF